VIQLPNHLTSIPSRLHNHEGPGGTDDYCAPPTKQTT
jgi:hypothetical protein